MLQGAYEKGQANKEQFKRDLDQGLSRAKEEAQAKKDELAAEQETSVREPVAIPLADTTVGRNVTGSR